MGREAPEEGRARPPTKELNASVVLVFFLLIVFLAGTSPSRGGSEDARNSQPPSSWPPLQDGQLGAVSAPEVSGSPSALEFERRRVGEPSGWIAAGTLGCGLRPLGASACL